ncbi:MAG: tetratricopeptide repeat protein [Balneolaceae bacterium]
MKKISHIFVYLLLVGLLYNCSSTDPFVSDIETSLILGNYDSAIEIAQDAVNENPQNGVAHYFLGVSQASKAQVTPNPNARQPLYRNARESIIHGKGLMQTREDRPDALDEFDDTITAFWAFEHNEGVAFLTDDSLRSVTPDANDVAIAHFINATTIQPDSAITYIALSSTQFNQGNIPGAIESYEMAIDRLDTVEIDDYDFLISLYILEERLDEAERLALRAIDSYPGETIFIRSLADVYTRLDRVDEAVALVRDLIAQEPNNPLYYRVLGTQIYQSVGELNEELTTLYEQRYDLQRSLRDLSGQQRTAAENEVAQISQQIDELEAEVEELTKTSIDELEQVVRLDPQDDSTFDILGIIHQNWASVLFQKRNFTIDDEEAFRIEDEAVEYLEIARGFYERAAEINPDNPDYWQSLFQVYTNLGMDEEAREAMEKAGL